jgi:hypothetical protein
MSEPAPGEAPPPEAPPADMPWHESVMTRSEDGTESLADFATWRDKAPPALSKFIADNMTAARAKQAGITMPGPDDPPEAWEAVYKAMGRPDTPDAYGFAKPEKMPDGVEWRDEDAAAYAQWSHAAGLNKAQASKMQELYTAHLGQQAAAMKAEGVKFVEAERAALKETYGATLADAAARAQQAAIAEGLDPKLFDPGAAEFVGVHEFKLVASLTAQLSALSKGGSFGDRGKGPAESAGYEWALAVTKGEHADSKAYFAGDAEIKKRVDAGWKQMPKGQAA